MSVLTCISGVGAKAAACFLFETAGKRIMLDLGEGPSPGYKPDLDGIGTVDAVVISHQHPDHCGGLDLLPQIGDPPVYMTAPVTDVAGAKLAPEARVIELPLRGPSAIEGVPVVLGRTGHAPGGVWLHFAGGDGFTYMNDHKADSLIFTYDDPPAAGTIVVDASYGADDRTLAAYVEAFEAVLDAGSVLLPVPVPGRGVEIALHLAATGRPLPAIDETMRRLLTRLADPWSDAVHPHVVDDLARLAAEAPAIGPDDDPHDGVMLVSGGNGEAGLAATLCERWEPMPAPAIHFSGNLGQGTRGARLVASGRATQTRWPIHASLSENVTLTRRTKARQVVPGFSNATENIKIWEENFKFSKIILKKILTI